MVSTSPLLILSVAIICVVGFWLCPKNHRDLVSAGVFLSVLATFDASATGIMLGLSLATYYFANRPSKNLFYFGILLIPSYLLITKYLPENCLLSDCDGEYQAVLIPLGISYLTFRLLHYHFDMHKQRIKEHTFSQFLLYCFFLPIYTAGPLQRFDKFLEGRKNTLQQDDITYGISRMIIGFIKAFSIPAIALTMLGYDTHQEALIFMFQDPSQHSVLIAWGMLMFFTLYFYLNLAGYADIAIGAGRLFGFKISENFANPFMATDMAQFWQRWHMTLGDWFKRYVFFPVAKKTNSFAIGLLASFVLIGLWHAGTLNWLVWGVFQGFTVYVSHILARLEPLRFLPKLPRHIVGSAIVFLTFSFSMSFVIVPTEFDFSYNIALIFALIGYG